jgi:Phosphorylated CTD interacting factor 1 WW domain
MSTVNELLLVLPMTNKIRKMKDNNNNNNGNHGHITGSALSSSSSSSIHSTPNVPPSRKNRKKPKLNSKRHVLSLTAPTGIGEQVASQPNRSLGQGKRTIWIGMEEKEKVSSSRYPKKQKKDNTISMDNDKKDTNKQLDMETTDTMLNESTTEAATTTTIYSDSPKCLVESQFATFLWKLRKQFVIQCRPIVPPILTLERWYQTIYMTMDNNDNDDENATNMDIANEGLRQDLQRVGMESSQIHSILQWLKEKQQQQHSMNLSMDTTTTTTTSTQQVSSKTNKRKKTSPTSSSLTNPTLHVIRYKHTLDLVLYPQKAQLWKLNYEHYDKLQALWMRTWKKKNNNSLHHDNDDNNNNNDDDNTILELSTKFHQDLFCLLCRYNSLQGPGFQAACPEQVFVVLQRQFQTSHECFASPLNCYFDSFCSAFIHVDEPFGSSGSFWDFQPKTTGGSFHVNPPFVHAIMVRMVTKLESLLSQDLLPLSFIIIVPVWLEDSSSYHALLTSPYKKHHFILAKADHGFCDGSQHQRRDRYRTSPYDTAVIVWQNKLGTQQYSPPMDDDDDWELEIRKAFATGVPTIAAKQRRIRDGRGLADEDGGGGKYLGRRQNQTGNGVQQRKRKERRILKKK